MKIDFVLTWSYFSLMIRYISNNYIYISLLVFGSIITCEIKEQQFLLHLILKGKSLNYLL